MKFHLAIVLMLVAVMVYVTIALPLDDDPTDESKGWNNSPSDQRSIFLLKKLKLKKLLLLGK